MIPAREVNKIFLDRGSTHCQIGIMAEMVSERINLLLKARGWKVKDLAVEIARKNPVRKLHQSQLSRLMTGKRPWPMAHLELVAETLGVQVGDLVDKVVKIPIVAEVSAHCDCKYPNLDAITEADILGYIPLPRIISENKGWPMAGEMYGLKVSDESYNPIIFKNTTLIVQKDGEKSDMDLVVYCDSSNRMHLGQLFFHEDNLLLRALNPNCKDLILPRRQLSMMDKIIAQIYI